MIKIRKSDWHNKLIAYCNAKSSVKFKYGSHDCVKFSAGAIKAMTGKDVLIGVTKYKTIKQGLEIIKSYGTLFDAVDNCLTQFPIEEVPVGEAVTGDVVGFINDKDNQQIGIMYDLGSVVSVAKTGLIYKPAHGYIKRCWSI